MRPALVLAVFLPLIHLPASADEAGAIAFFQDRGDRVTVDASGHATKLFSSGKPPLTVAELQRIGELSDLQELSLNAAVAKDGEWGFLRKLVKLDKLRIWHGHHFATLDAFSNLPVRDILIGGCMGLRDLNRDDPAALRDAVLTLDGSPEVEALTLYHSPLTPDDSHLAHLVTEFPNLKELRVDFAAPRGQEINVTPGGLEKLAELDLTRLAVENSEGFSPSHFAVLAGIASLQTLHIYPPRNDPDFDYGSLLAGLRSMRPELEVTFHGK